MNKYEGHTPGPWDMSLDEDIDDDVRQHIAIFSPTGDVAEAQGYDYETPEVRANAVLIADAPALLEENERLTAELENETRQRARLEARVVELEGDLYSD